jgi:DNA-binding MarR family transcriptional regulator
VQTSPSPALAEAPATAEEAVLLTLGRLGRRMRSGFPGEDLDFSAYLLLKTLLHGGPMRLSAVAGHLDLDASTVSRQVRHLEERGLVQRACDPDDGRASRIALTDEGAVRLEAGAERRRTFVTELLGDWAPDDRDQLRLLLTRLLDSLDHHQENA